ncbi:ATP-NAD kinase-like domain-containing protein [Gaertneriomyces semiglobifer]|nr:ATP-NAD kinase-like domain-containing protein [Gaertneriomyces semiglobifer]
MATTFTDNVVIHWDNVEAGLTALPGSLCGFSHRSDDFPQEAELVIDASELTLKLSSGNVVTIPLCFVFAARATPSKPKVDRTHSSSAAVLSRACALHSPTAGNKHLLPEFSSQFFMLYAVHLYNGRTDKQPKIRQVLVESRRCGASACIDHVRQAARIAEFDNGKLLILINPFGGTKKATQIFRDIVQPMLRLAGVEADVIETTHGEHATDIARGLNISEYKAAITISGDGLFHELINGLLTRPDWETARKLPIGVVGAGSANAMNKNLDTLFPELAVLSIIKLRTRPLDVFSVAQGSTVMYSHLQVMWALLADVDIESEKYRWMGVDRLAVAALIRLMRLREYDGDVWYLPAGDEDSSAPVPRSDAADNDESDVLTSIAPTGGPSHHGPPLRLTADPTAHHSWQRIPSSLFTMFIATNLPWISSDFLTAPKSRLNDGCIYMIWTHSMSTVQGLKAVVDQSRAAYLTFPYVNIKKVKGYVLEPRGWKLRGSNRAPSHLTGIMDVSGESVPYLPVRVEVHPGMMNVLAPEWLDEDEWERVAV